MKILIFASVLLLALHTKAQEITNYLFDADHQFVSDTAFAVAIIQKTELGEDEIRLNYLVREKQGWLHEDRYSEIRKLAENRYEELQFEDGLAKHRCVTEVLKQQGNIFSIREIEDDELVAEATVSNLFPRIYQGFRSRVYNDGTKVVELYLSNLKYDLAIQPNLTDRKMPSNKATYPAWYPGGRNRFISHVIGLAQVPDSLIDDNQKDPYFLRFTINQAGRIQELAIDGAADTLISGKLHRAILSDPWSWFPASDGNQYKPYSYVLPFYIYRHRKVLEGEISGDGSTGSENETVYKEVDMMPEYWGGEAGLRKFIASELHYPTVARKSRIQGKVYVSFVVDKQGFVQDVMIAKGVHPLLDRESMRVVRLMPQWKPGVKEGKTVKVRYTVPINFVLN